MCIYELSPPCFHFALEEDSPRRRYFFSWLILVPRNSPCLCVACGVLYLASTCTQSSLLITLSAQKVDSEQGQVAQEGAFHRTSFFGGRVKLKMRKALPEERTACVADPRCRHYDTTYVMMVCDGPPGTTAARTLAMGMEAPSASRPHCFHAALVRPMEGYPASGPSVELMHHRWLEQKFLRPLFEATLNGTCTRADGSRKVVVDVGANIGLYALYFATRGCEVHAIEALPVNADHVRLAASINRVGDRLHVHRVAASARDGENVTLRFSWQETGLTHVAQPFETLANSSNRYVSDTRKPTAKLLRWHELRNVRSARIDSLLHSRLGGREIDWLKVDVEGSELAALCGASGVFRRAHVRWLGFELNSETTSRAQAMRIRRLLGASGMAQRHLSGLGKDGTWRWREFLEREKIAWRRKGYMVTYERSARAAEVWDEAEMASVCAGVS